MLAPDRPRFTIVAVTDAYLRATGTTRAIVGRGVFEVFPDEPDDPASAGGPARASLERVLETGAPDTMAVRRRSVPRPASEGGGLEERCWSPVSAPVLGEAGEVLYLQHRVEDVTGLVRGREEDDAARALRESEERYRTLFSNMTEGFALGEAILDPSGGPCDFRLLEMNEAFERQSGLAREAARGRPIREVLPRIERSWIEAFCAVAGGAPARRVEGYNGDLGRHFSVYCFSPTPGRFAIFFSDVTARKRAEEALRERTAVIRAITDTSEDVIYVKDTGGRLVFANPATLALVGKPLDQVLGRTDLEILEDEAAARQVMENDRRILERGVAEEVEEHVPLPDGTDRIWASRKSAYRDERGEVVGLIGISRDITGRKRIEDALRDADRRKDDFLGMLSHELRNPLAPIRASTYVLRRADPASERAARALSVIERQTEHLARLVDDLLDVTRIGRGKIELRRAAVDLRELVHRAAEDFRLLLDDRGVAFALALPDGPAWADVDATRVTQVVGNLLHNATKFTRRGDRVSVSLSTAGGQATIAVRDTGAGVERGLLPAIFDPFVQGARSLARTEGGLGLGLALVKGITELHGGAVAADSPGPGRGSEFVVRLPLAEPPAPAEPRGAPAERRRSARLVLVVDDNADAADTLAELVRLLGHDVQVAYDGLSAVQAARASRPDVVLCDLGLPGMDGYDVARALRAGDCRPLRLVAVSGYAQPDDVRRATDAGFDAHVAKPPDPAEIERLLA